MVPHLYPRLQYADELGYQLMFFIPLYFEITKNSTPGEAGAYMLPSIIGNTVGGLLTGILIKRYGRYRLPIILATISSILCFSLLLVFWSDDIPAWKSLFSFPGGFGTGVAHSGVFVALAGGVKEEEFAIAGSGLYLGGSIGSVAGLCATNAAFQGLARTALREALNGSGIPDADVVSYTLQLKLV